MAKTFDRKWVVTVAAIAMGVIALFAGWLWVAGRASVEGDTPAERVECIGKLADEQPLGAAGAIASAAGDPSPAVREAALVALGRFADPKHRQTVESALRDPEPAVRAGAARSLGRYGDQAAADTLGALLAGEKDPSVRQAVADGLGRAPCDQAVAHLMKLIETDADAKVRLRALNALTRRLGVRFHSPPDPMSPTWRVIVAKLRRFPTVRRAMGEP